MGGLEEAPVLFEYNCAKLQHSTFLTGSKAIKPTLR